jgi:RNA polymerase sigma factor (sigma-70 family)
MEVLTVTMTAVQRKYLDDYARSEQGRLLGFIRKRVADEEDARDIMQDVLYQLTIGFNDLRSAGRISAWIFTVARNRITDYRRKHRPERLQDKAVRQESGEEPLMMEDILPALTRSPEDEFMRQVIWERIEATLERLPEKQRDVFIMNEFEDMSFREISAITGEGINTLLSRKRYAVIYLREQLKDLYEQIK